MHLSDSCCELDLDHHSLRLMVLMSWTVPLTSHRRSLWCRQVSILPLNPVKDVESATSRRNTTDNTSTSLTTLLSIQSRTCLRITPTPYSLFQRRFSCRDMTTQRTAEIEGKKYHTGGRLCSDDQRADQTTSKGCEKMKADYLYGKRDR